MTQHRKEMYDLSSSECKPVLNYSNALTKPEMDVGSTRHTSNVESMYEI